MSHDVVTLLHDVELLLKILLQVIKSYAKFSATPKYMTYN